VGAQVGPVHLLGIRKISDKHADRPAERRETRCHVHVCVCVCARCYVQRYRAHYIIKSLESVVLTQALLTLIHS
jgi:hypothetical protein